MSPLPCLGITYFLTIAILQQLGTELGDTTNVAWIVGAFTIASAVTFSISGAASDVFGRRWTIIAADVFSLIAAVWKDLRRINNVSLTVALDCWCNRPDDKYCSCSYGNIRHWLWICLCCIFRHFRNFA